MIVFIYGTTAEAIKLAPVMRRLSARGIPFEQWLTYQHTDALKVALPELGLPQPTRVIANGNGGRPLKGYADVAKWLISIQAWKFREVRALRQVLLSNTIIVVHGDTMTSVVGAHIARRLKIPSAHVEAGMRTGDWRNPFPEELNRRIVGRWASIHYAPTDKAADNLIGRANIIKTYGNTVNDAVLDHVDTSSASADKFGLVLLHRFELISNPELVESAIQILGRESPVPLKILVDAYSEKVVQDVVRVHGQGRIIPQPKLRHEEFVALLKQAEFIVTDSGGIQEEAALLGVPTLIHRKTTEHRIEQNAVLSEWDNQEIVDFLHTYETYRQPMNRPEVSPSDVIVDDLIARGYARS